MIETATTPPPQEKSEQPPTTPPAEVIVSFPEAALEQAKNFLKDYKQVNNYDLNLAALDMIQTNQAYRNLTEEARKALRYVLEQAEQAKQAEYQARQREQEKRDQTMAQSDAEFFLTGYEERFGPLTSLMLETSPLTNNSYRKLSNPAKAALIKILQQRES